jgi:hypothetical protein
MSAMDGFPGVYAAVRERNLITALKRPGLEQLNIHAVCFYGALFYYKYKFYKGFGCTNRMFL